MVFNSIGFCIWGIPAYLFCALCGFVITTCTYIILMSSKKYDLSSSMKILFIALVGMAIGAKLFGYISGIYRDVGLGKKITIESVRDTGIVYYGGLFGLITTYLSCLCFKKSNLDKHSIDVLVVCIPLFHSISRVGCFLSGCCYGKVYNGRLSVCYTTLIEQQENINYRFPVQLVEALLEVIIFLYLLFVLRDKNWKKKNILYRYLMIYGIMRFFLEFFRGDVRRGIIYEISFSQGVSVLIWIVVLGHLFKQRYFRKIKGGL